MYFRGKMEIEKGRDKRHAANVIMIKPMTRCQAKAYCICAMRPDQLTSESQSRDENHIELA